MYLTAIRTVDANSNQNMPNSKNRFKNFIKMKPIYNYYVKNVIKLKLVYLCQKNDYDRLIRTKY
jgi:hypothetical protein